MEGLGILFFAIEFMVAKIPRNEATESTDQARA